MTENDFNIIKPVAGSHNSIPSDSVKREKKHKQQSTKKNDKDEQKDENNQPKENSSENDSETNNKEQKRGINDTRTNRLDFRA